MIVKRLLGFALAAAIVVFAGTTGAGVLAKTDGGDGARPTPANQAADKRQGQNAVVDHVADGDTIQVQIGRRGREEDARLIGIDTPEVYFGAECGGPQASASMKRMLHPGDRVRLIRDRTQENRDHYDRLLRYVQLDGRDLGRVQIRKGWAEVYVFEDPFERVGSYRRAEHKARAADRGVWGRCGGQF